MVSEIGVLSVIYGLLASLVERTQGWIKMLSSELWLSLRRHDHMLRPKVDGVVNPACLDRLCTGAKALLVELADQRPREFRVSSRHPRFRQLGACRSKPRVASAGWLYSSGMTGRIGAKGQVVIPKALRDRAHLQPGDEVDFELRDEEIVLYARRSPVRLGGRFANTGMAARLLEDRAREPR